METVTFRKNLTKLLKSYPEGIARVWGTNALGKESGLLVGGTGTARMNETVESNKEPELLSPVEESDLKGVTIPDLTTYYPLPIADDAIKPAPLGMVFCDRYDYVDGSFQLRHQATDVNDLSSLENGITGPEIEFLYDNDFDAQYASIKSFRIPVFRDDVSPGLPKATIQSLFRFGSSDRTTREHPSVKPDQPKLRSAI
jgi:hypothetical protein